jgi:Zn-dependent peptidase ImmA (M78 family)/transcriptional regulator with XRE-family HTH domain
MRVGTPGFVAERLTEAREARGLAQTALSELTGIKSQSISHYEQGRQSPSPEALHFLCEKLELPERYFLKAMPVRRERPIFFRFARPHVRIARIQAERRLEWLKEISAYLRRHVDIPAANIPEFPVALTADAAEIESAAEESRKYFHLGGGPVAGVVLLLENAGCIVSRGVVDGDSESACSQWDEDAPSVLLGRDDSPSKSRLDALHELGHLVMHRGVSAETCSDTDAHRILEHQAEHFARAFLLPARAFRAEVWAPTVDALLALKKEWNAPVAAMIARCGEIGAFDADQVRRAQMNLARRGWKAGEPAEDAAVTEAPRLMARCVRLLIEAGVKDRHSLITDLSLNPGDIEELAGLPAGYFSMCEVKEPLALRLRGERVDVGV